MLLLVPRQAQARCRPGLLKSHSSTSSPPAPRASGAPSSSSGSSSSASSSSIAPSGDSWHGILGEECPPRLPEQNTVHVRHVQPSPVSGFVLLSGQSRGKTRTTRKTAARGFTSQGKWLFPAGCGQPTDGMPGKGEAVSLFWSLWELVKEPVHNLKHEIALKHQLRSAACRGGHRECVIWSSGSSGADGHIM